MSLLLYSQIPGTQVKRDVDLSNATIQCDPKLLFPEGASQGGVPLNKENLAGKIAVEHDICNLDVNNLTVNGVLVVKGPAEVCNIVCPEDFTVTAGINIIETATAGSMSLNAPAGDIVGNAINVQLTASTGSVTLKAATAIQLNTVGTGANPQLQGDVVDLPDGLTTTAGTPPLPNPVGADCMNAIINLGRVQGTGFNLLSMGSADTLAGGNQLLFLFRNNKIVTGSRIVVSYENPVTPFAGFVLPVVSVQNIINGSCLISVCNAGSDDSGLVDLGLVHVSIINPIA